MIFHYEAMDSTGQIIKDSVTATDPGDAVEKIHRLGLFVTSIKPDDPLTRHAFQKKSELLEEKIKQSQRRLKTSYKILGLAGLNCLAALVGLLTRNHYVTMVSIPISAFVCFYGFYAMRKSIQSAKEVKEIANEYPNSNGTS